MENWGYCGRFLGLIHFEILLLLSANRNQLLSGTKTSST